LPTLAYKLDRLLADGDRLAKMQSISKKLGRPNAAREIRYGIVIIVLGVAVYLLRAWRKRAWPFGVSTTSEALAE